VSEFQDRAERAVSKLPTGLLVPPGQRELWLRIFEILKQPRVVFARKLRALHEVFQATKAPAEMLDWLLALVGCDDGFPVSQLLDTPGQRAMVRFAPELFRTRGTREGIRLAASQASASPAGVFDWFATRICADDTPFPWFGADSGDQYETVIHVPDPATTIDRSRLEAMIRINLALVEIATVVFVDFYDDGSTGLWQWSDAGEILDVPDEASPQLRIKEPAAPASVYARSPDLAALTSYTVWFAVTFGENGGHSFTAYHDPAVAVSGYTFAVASGSPWAWGLARVDPAITWLAVGNEALQPGVTYLLALELATDAGGTWIRVTIDGNEIANVFDPAPAALTAGTVLVQNATGDLLLDFVDVFRPNADTLEIEHASALK
jgi:phage tail-like protein